MHELAPSILEFQRPVESSGSPRAWVSSCGAGFGLFLLLNAVLIVRPAEIIPALEGWPIYEVVILGCLLASLPAVCERLTASSLAVQPGAVCVLGFLVAIVLSHLSHGNIWAARMGGTDFLKVVLYYVLLLGLVNSPARLRTFLLVTVAFVLVLAILSLLEYHGVIDVPALAPCQQPDGHDELTGEPIMMLRLQALGIFSDPNDFALVLACVIFIGMHRVIENRRLLARLLWLGPISICGYAFALTHSRGGFLALVSGLLAYVVARRGWRRSILPLAVALPILLVAFGGRQTDIDLSGDNTGHGRILLWRDAMMEWRGAPVFGIGYGKLAEAIGLVAHNSYVNSYAELGLLGGTCFIGAFYLAIVALRRHEPGSAEAVDPELLRWRPCLLAMTVGWAVGLCSLTRSYALPTYLILGVAAAYGNLVAKDAPSVILRLNAPLVRRLGVVSLLCFVSIWASIKLFAN